MLSALNNNNVLSVELELPDDKGGVHIFKFERYFADEAAAWAVATFIQERIDAYVIQQRKDWYHQGWEDGDTTPRTFFPKDQKCRAT